MSSFLILYGTDGGRTATVAGRIATTISERGHEASAFDAFAADVAAFVEGRLGVAPDTAEDPAA